jgi:hypothetical protein
VRYHGLVFAVPVAMVAALVLAVAASADAGASLTVPAQVQAASGSDLQVQPSFSFPESTPFCTVGVDFTWDGANWLSEFPNKNGELCVAGGVKSAPPEGKAGAGAHQICGSAGPRFKECKTVTVLAAAGGQQAQASAKPNPGSPAQQAPAGTGQAAPAPGQAEPSAQQSAPAGPAIVVDAANRLSPESRTAGLVILGVGVLGLLLVLARRMIASRRRRATPLPTPGERR